MMEIAKSTWASCVDSELAELKRLLAERDACRVKFYPILSLRIRIQIKRVKRIYTAKPPE